MTARLAIASIAAVVIHLGAAVGFCLYPWPDSRGDADPPAPTPSVQNKYDVKFFPLLDLGRVPDVTSSGDLPEARKATEPAPPVSDPIPQTSSEPPDNTPVPSRNLRLKPQSTKPEKTPELYSEQIQAEKAEAEQRERERAHIMRMRNADEQLRLARQRAAEAQQQRRRENAKKPVASSRRSSTRAPGAKPQKPRAAVARTGETRGPIRLRQPQPRYPRSLERKGIGGTANVEIKIDARGRVNGVALARSSGHAELDRAALAAVKRWRFKPALKNGVKVAAKTAVNIVFQPK